MTTDSYSIVDYFEQLVSIPSPTGFTRLAQEYLIAHALQNSIPYYHTRKGAVRFDFAGGNENGKVIAFAAHVDTLGAIVRTVEGKKLKIAPVGSIPAYYAIGDYCTIHSLNGEVYYGTILPENPSVHVNKKWSDTVIKFDDLFVRIDQCFPAEKVLSDIIPVGSYITFDPKFRFENGFVNSRFLDDKVSAAVLLALSDQLLKRKELLANVQSVHLFFNVTEETGQGLAGLPEKTEELIVVDMGVVGEGVTGDENHVAICLKDSSGPYHYELTKDLIGLAKRNSIAYNTDIFPFYSSDGSAALSAGTDIRVALIGPGVYASHGYERTHVDALNATFTLLCSYLEIQ